MIAHPIRRTEKGMTLVSSVDAATDRDLLYARQNFATMFHGSPTSAPGSGTRVEAIVSIGRPIATNINGPCLKLAFEEISYERTKALRPHSDCR